MLRHTRISTGDTLGTERRPASAAHLAVLPPNSGRNGMYAKTIRLLALAGILAIASLAGVSPALAQLKIPNKAAQEVLIKTTLLTFNDANVTGNYTVLHAKGAKPFRDQFPPERLKEVFKAFVDNHIDFDIIAARTPLTTQEAKINDEGVLSLQGYFDTTPNHVYYDLNYILSEGEWKPIKINVNVKAPDKK